jgi:hypothetical protein
MDVDDQPLFSAVLHRGKELPVAIGLKAVGLRDTMDDVENKG